MLEDYNYFRTYDPSTGRYLESDPIGLRGGINTYGYSYQNPVRYIDPDGKEVVLDAGLSGGWFWGLGGTTLSGTIGISTDFTLCGTQLFGKYQFNPMLGAGYWTGIGGTGSAGYNDGPLPSGFNSGLVGHFESAGSSGIPLTWGGSVDSDGGGLAIGHGFIGIGEGLYGGTGISKYGYWASRTCGCGEDNLRRGGGGGGAGW